MATSARSQKHFRGVSRTGHNTPEQFREIVQRLLSHSEVTALTSGPFRTGTGGRLVRRMRRTVGGLLLRVQAAGLRQEYHVVTAAPDEVAGMLAQELDFDPLQLLEEPPAVGDVPEDAAAPTLDLPRLLARVPHTPHALALAVLVNLADPHTAGIRRRWTSGASLLDLIADVLPDGCGTEASEALTALAENGRVVVEDEHVQVLVPLDLDGTLLLPYCLPAVATMLEQDPPVGWEALVAADDEDALLQLAEDWALRMDRHSADLGVPAFIRPFLADALVDEALGWAAAQRLGEAGPAPHCDWPLSRLAEALRSLPQVLDASAELSARDAAAQLVSDYVMQGLAAHALALRQEIQRHRAAQEVLALMCGAPIDLEEAS